MFYRKNLPGWERALRVIAGLIMIAAGLTAPGLAGTAGGIILAIAGLGAAGTGFMGFCPACAMVGRKLR